MATAAELLVANSTLDTGTALEHIKNLNCGLLGATTGETLALNSSLSTGTAAEHLLNLRICDSLVIATLSGPLKRLLPNLSFKRVRPAQELKRGN